MHTTDDTKDQPELRPDELVPYVREYLGLMEEKNVLDKELKRCMNEYKKVRERLFNKRKPIHERFIKIEDVLKKTIIEQKLPGIKYKQHVFTIEEKPVYKPPVDKIVDALNNNPIENYSENKETLAKIIAECIKKKIRDHNNKNNYTHLILKTRVIT